MYVFAAITRMGGLMLVQTDLYGLFRCLSIPNIVVLIEVRQLSHLSISLMIGAVCFS